MYGVITIFYSEPLYNFVINMLATVHLVIQITQNENKA